MGIVEDIIAFTQETFIPFGTMGLFIVAFMESSFFPVPPDLLLIPLALADPANALLFAAIATAGSVSGSLVGYYIGKWGGRPLLIKVIGKRRTAKVHNYFSKYGDWAIGIAGFTPIPYKVFTIAAGAFHHSILRLVLISFVSRGARFFLIGTVAMLWGERIISFLDSYFEIFTVVLVAAIVGGYLLYKKFLKKIFKP